MEKIIASFMNYWDGFISVLPDIAFGIIFLVIGLLVAKFLSALIRRLFKRLGLDALAERVGLAKMLNGFGIKAGLSSMLASVLYYTLVLFVFMLAAEQMNIAALTAAISSILAFVPKVLTALIIFVIGSLIADRIKDAIATVTQTLGISGGRVISQIVYAVIMMLVSITALNMAGIDTTLITSNILVVMASMLMAFGIAYGFASKDILQNILSSYYGRDRFKVGMRIRLGQDEGIIEKIDSISIYLNCGDKTVMIPCNKLITERIEVLKDQ